MPATLYTIVAGGVEKSAAAWGIENDSFIRTRNADDLGRAQVTFTTVQAEFSDDPIFAEGTEIVVWAGRTLNSGGEFVASSGRRWFCGRVKRIARQRASNGFHFHKYLIANRAQELADENYLQKQFYQDGTTDGQGHRLNNTASFYVRDVLVPFEELTGYISTERQVKNCITYAITDVLPPIDLQLGSVVLAPGGYDGGTIPLRQFQGPKIGEVIGAMMDASMDSVAWIDDSTTPSTWRAGRWAALPSVTIPLSALGNAEAIEIEPLTDLVADGVLFQFRRTDEMDGVSAQVLTFQSSSAAGTFSWRGARIVVLRSDIEVEALRFFSADWWAENNSPLGSEMISDLTIANVSAWIDGVKMTASAQAALFADLPNELLDGVIEDWMLSSTRHPSGVSYQRIELRCEAKFKRWKDAAHTLPASGEDYTTRDVGIEFHVDGIIVTDATSGVYRDNVVAAYADDEPPGLARWFYEGASVLHYGGSIEIVDAEIADSMNPGQRVNLSGGRAEWLTMNALVSRVVDGPGAGRTTVTFGPPKSRNARDRIDALKMNRVQGRRTTNAGTVQTGVGAPGQTVSQSTISKKPNSTSAFTGGGGGGNAVW